MMYSILRLQKICKSFHGFPALKDVDLEIQPGKITVLLGANGAGKSTLMSIISGDIMPDSGNILYDDHPVHFQNPADAQSLGIMYSPQEAVLFDNLSIVENLYINHELTHKYLSIRRKEMYTRAQELLSLFNIHKSPDTLVRNLSAAEKNLIQYARALIVQPRILLLDEISSSLTHYDLRKLYESLRMLRNKGTAIVYITHLFAEVQQLADHVVILKDGCVISESSPNALDSQQMIGMMLGDAEMNRYPKLSQRQDQELLRVSHISNAFFKDISFTLMRGEILGIVGLTGSGRTKLIRALAGIEKVQSGSIIYDDQYPIEANKHSPALKHIAYLPENRDAQALFLEWSLAKNITIRNLQKVTVLPGKINHRRECISSGNEMNKLGVHPSNPAFSVSELSDGNKQKLLVCRSIFSNCDLFLLDEPTKGVDVAGKVSIYNLMNELTAKGAGIIMVSSDFSELIHMCDRVILIQEGCLRDVISTCNLDLQYLYSKFK